MPSIKLKDNQKTVELMGRLIHLNYYKEGYFCWDEDRKKILKQLLKWNTEWVIQNRKVYSIWEWTTTILLTD